MSPGDAGGGSGALAARARRRAAGLAGTPQQALASRNGGSQIAMAVDELCRTLVQDLGNLHPDHELVFDSDGPCSGCWDPVRIGQLVTNLLVNAIQHGSAGGRVELSLRSSETVAEISVFNQGPPIAPEAQAAIFEPFRRGSSGGGGLGLGLFIVREIARAHGAEVAVASTEGGTRFTVALPRK